MDQRYREQPVRATLPARPFLPFYGAMNSTLPHGFSKTIEWRNARTRAGALLVALDFDGTLVPLQDEPADVRLSADVQALLASLEARADTRVALVSGRSLQDLEKRVGVPGIVYAGNHGLEIGGAGIQLVHELALAARHEVERAGATLRALVDGSGAWVEDKGLSLAVHYRQARIANVEQVLRERVTEALSEFPLLRLADGKKIFEVVPAIPWDKGSALKWISGQLRIPEDAPVLFVGDDRTDEDAFRVVAAHGGGIIVADRPPTSTAATSFLRSPTEVIEFLKLLA